MPRPRIHLVAEINLILPLGIIRCRGKVYDMEQVLELGLSYRRCKMWASLLNQAQQNVRVNLKAGHLIETAPFYLFGVFLLMFLS